MATRRRTRARSDHAHHWCGSAQRRGRSAPCPIGKIPRLYKPGYYARPATSKQRRANSQIRGLSRRDGGRNPRELPSAGRAISRKRAQLTAGRSCLPNGDERLSYLSSRIRFSRPIARYVAQACGSVGRRNVRDQRGARSPGHNAPRLPARGSGDWRLAVIRRARSVRCELLQNEVDREEDQAADGDLPEQEPGT